MENEVDFKNRLEPGAAALVEKAIGYRDRVLLEALLNACHLLEESSKTDTPILAIERDARTDAGTYHLFVRRLSSSIPSGKFQILIVRELASGLIY